MVYHVNGNDPGQQASALRNIQNHINAVGEENLDLRVVIHGNGVSLLLLPEALTEVPKAKRANATEQIQAKIDVLRGQGARFLICANTLKMHNLKRKQLYKVDAVDVVPSGLAELAQLQARGYTYIKP